MPFHYIVTDFIDEDDEDGPEPTDAELEQHLINMAKALGAN